ncbi:MAG TPA: nitroreductase family deazaflavin-dependent oxidoreductase [Chloroflexota bacterium]|nr:nitroreductase family deazaflavin-dependent oxidoreductase [Chloroflexota bacterium]
MTETSNRGAATRDDWNSQVIEQFRANTGTMVSGPFAGRPLLLLSTTGARSGQTRINPLVYTRDGDKYVVIASKGGAPTNPDWYHNVVKNPQVTLEVGPETFTARASIVEGAERQRLYDAQAALMPNFAEYQEKTDRQIPVIVLERIG